MDIEFQCGACGQSISVDGSGAGATVACPTCQSPVVVPKPRSAAAVRAVPLPVAGSAETDDAGAEREVLSTGPSSIGYLGRAIAGLLFCLAGIVFLFSIPVAGAVLLCVGVLLLISIWVAVATIRYRLTDQRLICRRGLIARRIEEVELFRVKDVTVSQGLLERILGIGSVVVLSTDDSTPRVLLHKIPSPMMIKEELRGRFRAARRRERVGATEFIPS